MSDTTALPDLQKVSQAAWLLLARYPSLTTDEERRSFIFTLAPRPEDFFRVFQEAAAEAARRAYEPLWMAPPLWPLRPDQTRLKVVAATLRELRDHTGLSAEFPGGYQDVLLHYRAETVLLCWEYTAPDSGAGLSFDGLIPIDDRWAWFPKPWRVLPSQAAPLQHWLA